MSGSEQAFRSSDLGNQPLRPVASSRVPSRTRTVVVRRSSPWALIALLCLSLLMVAVVVLGYQALRRLEGQHRTDAEVLAAFERKVQDLEAGMPFESRRRQLLLGMRDHILRVNPRIGLGEAYRYAQLALEACERYPAVDPLLLLAIGTVESRYDPRARSHADARGLYQIWPSTGRLLFRGLGWSYDDDALYDPEKNTLAATLYLDMLFSAYSDPQLVLAEYNGGPLNAGYFRAGVDKLAAETRNYVPQVLHVYGLLTKELATVGEPQVELMHLDARRGGKRLGDRPAASAPAPAAPR
jgi:hypothetical protein